MKVYLSDLVHNMVPGGNILTGKHSFVVPLNIACIAAYSKQIFNNDIEIKLFKYPNDLLSEIDNNTPNIIGMSNYAWNSDLNFQICKYVKDHYKNVTVVIGGPSIRTLPSEIENFLKNHQYIDAYAMFEGEQPFADIIRHVLECGSFLKNEKSNLENVAYLTKDGQFKLSLNTNFQSLGKYNSPYLNGMLDTFLSQELIPLFETNRGCPYNCIYCTWGIASLKKVRQFPIDRIYAEFDYVAKNFPHLPIWILADANFGIFPRDVEIARKIHEIQTQNLSLKKIISYDAKNKTKYLREIGNILRAGKSDNDLSKTNMICRAVQHLSPKILKNIKRHNIPLKDLDSEIKWYHHNGIEVRTDILYALSGESLKEAIEALKMCFKLKFDLINETQTLMLPGSELETSEYRQKYGLKTKYMIRQGAYGEYTTKYGILRAMEFDEPITSTSTFSESEILCFHLIQIFLFYSWNHKQLIHLFNYVMNEYDKNPVYILDGIMHTCKTKFPLLSELLNEINRDFNSILFDSPDEMRRFYYDKQNWSNLLKYIRVELKYNAILFTNIPIHNELCDCIEQLMVNEFSDSILKELLLYTKMNIMDVEALMNGFKVIEKSLILSGKAVKYIIGKETQDFKADLNYEIKLYKSENDQSHLKDLLINFGYSQNPIYAIERVLGGHTSLLIYDRSIII
ncbi:MAG: cobalamin-dependent protein [Desulfobacterales bacterium]|nr:cobalamin-dependent protein [Desulfobacterales bacterium]